MITNEEFNHGLPKLQNVLSQYLDSKISFTIVTNSISQVMTKQILRFNIQFQNHTILKLIYAYDDIYKVPILYFQKSEIQQDEETFIQFTPDQLNTELPLTHDLIPYSIGSWMFIHPCEVHSTMDIFEGQDEYEDQDQGQNLKRIRQYLITWNAIYGTGIFKDLTLRYTLNTT